VDTLGRITGQRAKAAVGFVMAPDGAYIVAAVDPDADWARNLEADPRCTIWISGATGEALAEPLDDAERNAAITALILKYGTPAERLGRGPAFRLRPTGTLREAAS
jgi:deazaflavin-dependent oxidoreductase (nitroreductase family)